MTKVRGKNNKSTEVRLKMALVRAGVSGWNSHVQLPGRPDFYFRAAGLAIFVDGCFWHGCKRCGHIPKTHSEFWKAKLARNKARDARNRRSLKAMDVKVLRLWEHQLRDNLPQCVAKILKVVEAA
jgi:DNA mismatch endonuclease, patch repair protein